MPHRYQSHELQSYALNTSDASDLRTGRCGLVCLLLLYPGCTILLMNIVAYLQIRFNQPYQRFTISFTYFLCVLFTVRLPPLTSR